MRLMAFFMVLLTSSAMAEINSSQHIFFGESKPSIESCGVNGRMLKSAEIENIGRQNLCVDVKSPWALWKVQGNDGSFWTLAGSGYSCDLKAGSNPNNQSLCVMKDEAPNNRAYIFESNNFKGKYPWSGLATINTIGDEVPESSIKSFKLGNGVQLVAYPDPNFRGAPRVFTNSTEDARIDIKSYKLKAKQLESNVTFELLSYSQYRTCLKLKASLSVTGLIDFCSEDTGNPPKVLTQIAGQEISDTIAIYVEEYIEPYVTVTSTGVIYILFDGQGSFTLGHNVLPSQLSVTQDGNNLVFIYK